jgi:hypothetical protein
VQEAVQSSPKHNSTKQHSGLHGGVGVGVGVTAAGVGVGVGVTAAGVLVGVDAGVA